MPQHLEIVRVKDNEYRWVLKSGPDHIVARSGKAFRSEKFARAVAEHLHPGIPVLPSRVGD